METAPSYLTSDEAALRRAENLELQILAAADGALTIFLDRVVADAVDGSITRGSVVGYFIAGLGTALSHPAFAEVRDELLAELDRSATVADDAYTVATMALEVAANSGATPEERAEFIRAIFPHPSRGLVASLSERVDAWLRKRISRLLTNRVAALGPEDLMRDDLLGREFEIPEEPGRSTTVSEDDWAEDDRPGEINWRARMRRDIRTAYTAIFGRQLQRQLERYGFPAKRWVSRQDERVRETHRHAHGQTVGIYETFRVGAAFLRYPGDPTGPVGETINCRCSIVGAS